MLATNIHHEWRTTLLWCSICHCSTVWEEKKSNNKEGIPDLLQSLDTIRELHLRKNQDYAASDNPFSNFEFTEFVLSHFNSDRDKSFIWPIATKLARLSTLLNSGNNPNNESIEDSFLDIATYVLLWKADYARRSEKQGTNPTSQT